MKMLCITLASTLLLTAISGTERVSSTKVVRAHGVFSASDVPDAAPGQPLPGFENGYANLNETRLHYAVVRVIEAMAIRFGICNPPNVSG